MVTKLLIATGNLGKLREYATLLAGLPYQLVSLNDVGITQEVNETGETFEENAWLKASEYSSISGLLTLADDSGLEVDSLNGDPGVRSARYGGEACRNDEDRVALLLKNMEDIPWEKRGAQFQCVIAIADPSGTSSLPSYSFTDDQKPHPISPGKAIPRSDTSVESEPSRVAQAEGSVAGMIQYESQGKNGFGYDPVFYLPEYGQTAAQLSPTLKNQISHRAKAVESVAEALQKLTTYR